MECRICKNKENNTLYVAREMMYGMKVPFNYWQCSACGCLQIEDFPSDISSYYPSDSYHSFNTPQRFFRHPVKNRVKGIRDFLIFHSSGSMKQFLARALRSDPLVPVVAELRPKISDRILDIGCGAGVLLYTLRNAGYRHVSGIDPFIEKDIHYSNGLQIRKQYLSEHEGEYDIVMMHHAFEHVAEQQETILKMHRVLAVKGKLMIRIPIASSYAWDHYKTNWVQLDAPRHFFLHSVKSMTLLAADHGFRLKKIIYDSAPIQFWGSELYSRDLPLKESEKKLREIFDEQQIAEFYAHSQELNRKGQGDQAAFIFEKSDDERK